MKLKSIHIEATTLSDAWYQALYNSLEHGRRFKIDRGSNAGQDRMEFDYITINIANPGVRPLLPELPAYYNLPNPVAEGYLDEYMPYLMTGDLKDGESYTYGQRICAYPIPLNRKDGLSEDIYVQEEEIWYNEKIVQPIISPVDESVYEVIGYTLNQMELIIWTYKNKGHRNNQMVMQVAHPTDVLLKDPPCVIQGSNITTEKGFIKAEDITTNDKVYSHTGNFREIEKVYKRKYKGKINIITTRNSSYKVALTPEHPVYAIKTEMCPYDKKLRCKPTCKKRISSYEKHGKKCPKLFESYKPEWVSVNKLNIDYFIVLPITKLDEDDFYFPTDEMWLYGIFLAEGDYEKEDGIRFNINNKAKEIVNKIINIMNHQWELKPHIQETQGTTRITFYSRKLVKHFKLNFGKGARTKKIPMNFIKYPNYKLESLLEGYIAGDGYKRKNREHCEYCTTSENLRDMFKLIMQKLGIIYSNHVMKMKEHEYQGRIIKPNGDAYILSYALKRKKNIYAWKDKDNIFVPVKSNTQLDYNGNVFNYEVKNDNSYTADGIPVHNCLRHIDTRIQDNKLHFFVYFRSWDLWGGFPANLGAIQQMKEYMASEIGVEDGEMIVASKGLHLYDYVFELAETIRGKTIEEIREGK